MKHSEVRTRRQRPQFTVMRNIAVAITVSLSISGCGGGGGGGGGDSAPPPINQTPPPTIAPAITSQPQDRQVNDGDSTSFTVTASGTAPFIYQWFRNGTELLGASNNSYALNATLADDGAQFTVTVSNSGGSTTSQSARLTVNPVAPSIDVNPSDSTVLSGTPASFSTQASGSAPLAFQWFRNGIAIPGATSAIYTIPSTTLADNGAQYNVIVTNTAGSLSSSMAALTVQTVITPPAITMDPQSISSQTGDAVSFTVAVTGTAPFTYQWRRNGVNIAGAQNATYSISPVTALNNGDSFSVVVSNASGSTSSDNAVLTVTSAPIDLIAGQLGGVGNLDGQGSAARFASPYAFAVDAAGNLYVRDGNLLIDGLGASNPYPIVRRISPTGDTTTLFPSSEIIAGPDSAGYLYVSATCSIDKVSPSGVATTFAGNPALDSFCAVADSLGNLSAIQAQGMAVAPDDSIYFTESNFSIGKVNAAGQISVLAGQPGTRGSVDDTGQNARFEEIVWISVDKSSGDIIAVEHNQSGYYRVRKITPNGVVTTISESMDSFSLPGGTTENFNSSAIAADANGNIYTSSDSTRFVKIGPDGVVSQFIGGSSYTSGHLDGSATEARFGPIRSIIPDDQGGVFVGETATIRSVTTAGQVTTLAGKYSGWGHQDGSVTSARFLEPRGLVFDDHGNVYVVDSNAVRVVSTQGSVTTLAGNFMPGLIDGAGTSARFRTPSDVVIDSAGNLFVSDSGNHAIRKISPLGMVSTFAGGTTTGTADGTGTAASFSNPTGIAIDGDDNLYVTDSGNSTIRKITPAGIVSTIAGVAESEGTSDGSALAARFKWPQDIAIDGSGNLYVADSGNHTIRKIDTNEVVSTVAGSAGVEGFADGAASTSMFRTPIAIVVDQSGDLLISDLDNHSIRKIAGGNVSTIAGVPSATSMEAGSIGVKLGILPGSLSAPFGIALPTAGSAAGIVISDNRENVVLSITP